MTDKPKQHRFNKNKDGLQIEVTDPIQDIMSDEELDEAHEKIQSLIEQQEDSAK